MHETEVPDWIDPTNACRVVIDVSSYSTVEEDRSVYKKGRRLDWWVDADEYSIIDMEKDVFEHFSWASYQKANFWYVGQNKETVRLGSDQELLTLLRGSKKVEFIMTVDRCVHVDMALTVTEVSVEENQVADLDGLEWALEPQLGVTAAGPSRVVEEGNHDLDPSVDHEGDDPVGADEEWRYFKKKMQVQGEGSNEKVQQEKKKVDSKKSVTLDIDPEAVPSDEATMLRDAPYVSHTTYDRDNPDIKEGSTFPDKKTFKLMIQQYAIKREFQTFVEYIYLQKSSKKIQERICTFYFLSCRITC